MTNGEAAPTPTGAVGALDVNVEGAVATVRLCAPSTRNALSNETLSELARLLEQFEQSGVKCAVLLGDESVFASGADLQALASVEALDHYFGQRRREWERIRQIGMPLVAAVSGYCLGGGLELALACDIVIVADNSTIGLPETSLGLIPGAGGTQTLPRVAGKSIAMDMILTGRRLTASDAVAVGIASRVVPLGVLEEEARAVASTIAERSRVASRLAKECVLAAFESPLRQGLESERRAFALALSSEEARSGIDVFLRRGRARRLDTAE